MWSGRQAGRRRALLVTVALWVATSIQALLSAHDSVAGLRGRWTGLPLCRSDPRPLPVSLIPPLCVFKHFPAHTIFLNLFYIDSLAMWPFSSAQFFFPSLGCLPLSSFQMIFQNFTLSGGKTQGQTSLLFKTSAHVKV